MIPIFTGRTGILLLGGRISAMGRPVCSAMILATRRSQVFPLTEAHACAGSALDTVHGQCAVCNGIQDLLSGHFLASAYDNVFIFHVIFLPLMLSSDASCCELRPQTVSEPQCPPLLFQRMP